MKNTWLFEMFKRFVLIYVATWLTPRKDKKLPSEIYQPTGQLKISYCTTCMGRTQHLKKTYIKNILDNLDYPHVEFILVNYNSADDMDEWVKGHLGSYIEKGIVVYYKTPDPKTFHMSMAKNLSHRLATGDVVVNLDADNYLGKDNAFFINHHYQLHGMHSILRFSKSDFRYFDTCGRIAMSKIHFEKLGGYREDLLPYGEEDLDLIRRAEAINCQVHTSETVNFLRTIKHTNTLRAKNYDKEVELRRMRQLNQQKVREGLENKQYKANPEGFQSFILHKNFETTPIKR